MHCFIKQTQNIYHEPALLWMFWDSSGTEETEVGITVLTRLIPFQGLRQYNRIISNYNQTEKMTRYVRRLPELWERRRDCGARGGLCLQGQGREVQVSEEGSSSRRGPPMQRR